MAFGFLGDIVESVVDTACDVVEDTINIGTSVITLGEYGELNSTNVRRLLDNGMSIYAISDATGVAVDVLQGLTE